MVVESKKLTILGLAGGLEALMQIPVDAKKNELAIVCHPLPVEGGTMHNKVVYTMGRCFHNLSISTLKFHTRGTGASEGKFDNGVGEINDLVSVIQHSKRMKFERIWLAGFSFGAYVAYKALHMHRSDFDTQILNLTLIAPPVNLKNYHFPNIVAPCDVPITVVQGDADEVVNSTDVYQWFHGNKCAYNNSEYISFADTGHFFHGQLVNLRKKLTDRYVVLDRK